MVLHANDSSEPMRAAGTATTIPVASPGPDAEDVLARYLEHDFKNRCST